MDSRRASKLFGIPRTTLKRKIGDPGTQELPSDLDGGSCVTMLEGSNIVSNHHPNCVERHLP